MKKNIYNQEFLYIKSQKEVESAINSVLDKGAEILYDKYLVDKWPQYVAEDIMYWADGIFSQKNIITDKGESKIQLQHRWKPEEEPITVGLDSRARFAVKVEYKQAQNELNDQEEVKSIQSTSSIGFSLKSSKVNNLLDDSMNQKGVSQNLSQNNDENKQQTDDENIPQAIKVGEDSEPPTPDPITEKLRENREKKEREKILKHKQEQKQQEEDELFKQRQNELSKQLRNKNVTFDNNGEIILKDIAAPEVVTYNMLQDMKKKKEKEKLDKAEPPPIQEFHKQPNQVDFLNPKTGVNVIFQNGYKKEGGFIEYNNKMRKSQYDEIVENSPNRPVPQYLQQNEDGFLSPPDNEFRLRLQNRLQQHKAKQRPNTAGNFYTPQGVLIGDQDLYMEMMAEEEQSKNNNKNKRSFLGHSRISQRSQKSLADLQKSNLTQSQIQNLKFGQKVVKNQKQRPATSKSENRIQLFKQQKVGLKGVEMIPYDLGVEYGKENKIEKIQENSQEQLQQTQEDNMEKMRKKVEKFNLKIKQDKNWGAYQQDMQLSNFNSQNQSKKKVRPTSYTAIKRTPNLLNNVVFNNQSIYPETINNLNNMKMQNNQDEKINMANQISHRTIGSSNKDQNSGKK
ncbi:hypothetical protein PPERSA_04835 [Pseudocohnilembus persalinus]|uniref:Uncharacterized protein n=1 Tax=Pseudocohnilembus persalinus TaxID=266149 RepID=A0A0V0QJM4_PSEPJ|nr:hypothetical protein PPERSA_04835 [Pseudocohnilembus persalinus]|eukprot:KRX02213.1 hypothetical protein PPERSA_04835 [Pseudocohnilembus persalinus]